MSRVTIFNKFYIYDICFSYAVVSLLNYQGDVLRSYRIGDGTYVVVFEINFDCFYRDLPYFAGEYTYGHRYCVHLCLIAGYQFAGTQKSNQRWCGNSYGQYGVDLNGCNMPCVGNEVEICGGPYSNSVYTTSQSGVLRTYAYLGCFSDGGGRDPPYPAGEYVRVIRV